MYDLSGVPGFWLVIRRSRVVGLRALWHLAASETDLPGLGGVGHKHNQRNGLIPDHAHSKHHAMAFSSAWH